MRLLSTRETAQRLKLSRQRVQALVAAGRLPAQKIGNAYVFREADVARLVRLPPHRPRKET